MSVVRLSSSVLRRLIGRIYDPYRPELHYMRGPGPKSHAPKARA